MSGNKSMACLICRLLMLAAISGCGFGFARALVPALDNVPLVVSAGFAILVYVVNIKYLKRKLSDLNVTPARPTGYNRLFDPGVTLQIDFDLALCFVALGIGSLAWWLVKGKMSSASATVITVGVAYLLSIVRCRKRWETLALQRPDQ